MSSATAGSAQSLAAGAVLAVFIIAGLFFWLSQKLWKKYKERDDGTEFSQQPGCSGQSKISAARGEDLENGGEGQLESSLDSNTLRQLATIVVRPQTPQTPAEAIALNHPCASLQRPSSRFSRQGLSSVSSPVRGMAAAPRQPSPDSFADRPRTTGSGKPAWCDEDRSESSRPWTEPSKDMRRSGWWEEAREWWPSTMASDWESPYRPSSTNAVRQKTPTSPQVSEDTESPLPDMQPTWPSRAYCGAPPMKQAYLWATWTPAPSATKDPKHFTHPFMTFKPAAPDPPSLPSVIRNPADACADDRYRSTPTQFQSSAPPHHTPPARPQTAAPIPSYSAPPQPARPATAAATSSVAQAPRVKSMLAELERTRTETLVERKRVFRDLQRELHPDKNVDCEEEAKMAFQELMFQRAFYLKP